MPTEIEAYLGGAALCISCCLLPSIAVYFVFGIIFLVKDRHVCNDQGDSNLWIFCLVLLISGTGVLLLANTLCPQRPDTEGIFFIKINSTIFCII